MIFTPTSVAGCYIIEMEPRTDDRGMFARQFCVKTWAENGLDSTVEQSNVSYTKHAGTIRGLHYQLPPDAETKQVRCTQGAIYDVCVDLRPNSPTFKQWFGIELSAENRKMLYVPKGCAHGFQSLTDDAEILYLVSTPYSSAQERNVKYNDPELAIPWPLPVTHVSEKDANNMFIKDKPQADFPIIA
jgi:dTDP-4-dehydrorhamnose 3,5-epimerase